MKSITVHNIDSDLAERIELHSNLAGISQSQLIKNVLRSSLGVDKNSKNANLHAFRFSLTKEEMDSFFAATRDLSQIERSIGKN